MLSRLLSDSIQDGIDQVEVAVLVSRNSHFLLIENLKEEYEVPFGLLKKDESLNQAVQRILIEKTYLSLTEVEKYLCHFDRVEIGKKIRRLYFIGKIQDSEDIQLKEHKGFAWKIPHEAVGYPISNELREAFDFISKS